MIKLQGVLEKCSTHMKGTYFLGHHVELGIGTQTEAWNFVVHNWKKKLELTLNSDICTKEDMYYE